MGDSPGVNPWSYGGGPPYNPSYLGYQQTNPAVGGQQGLNGGNGGFSPSGQPGLLGVNQGSGYAPSELQGLNGGNGRYAPSYSNGPSIIRGNGPSVTITGSDGIPRDLGVNVRPNPTPK